MATRSKPRKTRIYSGIKQYWDCGEKLFECSGYIRKGSKRINIGSVIAKIPSPGFRKTHGNYLLVASAYLDQPYTGKGYGHILYRRLAVFAKTKRFLGLQSIHSNRNKKSTGAWKKIHTEWTDKCARLHWSLKKKEDSVIRSLRQEAGLTLDELSDRLKWRGGKSRLSKYENGQIGLSTKVIDEIAKAIGVRPELIVFRIMQARYPNLFNRRSKTGKTLLQIVKSLEGNKNDNYN